MKNKTKPVSRQKKQARTLPKKVPSPKIINKLKPVTALFWQSTLDAVTDAVCFLDVDQRILQCNRAMTEMFGLTKKEIIGKNCWEIVHGTTKPILKCPATRARKSFAREKGEIRKGDRWFNIIADPILDKKGKIKSMVHTLQDITEHKRTTQALQESENKYCELVENVIDVIFMVDIEGCINYISPAIEHLTGYSTNEVIGTSITKHILPEDLPDVLASTNRILAGGKKEAVEYRVKIKNGEIRYVVSSCNVILKNGQPTGLTGVITDITERKQAEKDLQESESKYKLIIEKMTDMVWIYSMNLQLLYITPSVKTILGFSPEEDLSKTLEEKTTPESFTILMETMKKELAIEKLAPVDPNRTISIELELYHKDGSTRWLEPIMSWLRDDQGVVTGIYGTSRDITKRKRIEVALRESEEKFRLLSDQSLLATGFIQDGLFKYVNQAYCDISGYTFDEIIKWQPDEYAKVVHPDDRAFVIDQVHKKQSGNPDVVTHYQFRGLTKNKETRWLDLYSRTVLYKGMPADLVSFIDITELKQAEESLKEAELKFRTIFDSASDGILITDAINKYFISANEKICAMLGYTKEEILKLNVSDIHPKESLPYVIDQFEKLVRKEISIAPDIPVMKKDKTLFFVDINSSSIILEGKECLIGIFRDMSERKRTEEVLRQEQQFSKSVLDSLPEIFYLFTYPEKRLKLSNRQFQKLLGFNGEEIKGRHVTEWFVPEYREAVLMAIDKVMEKGKNSIEAPLLTNDGRQIPFFLTGTKFEVDDQSYFMGIGIDLTERNKTEKELKKYRDHLEELVRERTINLEAANKELEAFSYSVSHDLRAPLRSIKGFSQALLEDYYEKLNAQGRDYLTRIKTATRKMSDLIEDMLQLSQITRIEMNMEKVNLSLLARSVISELHKSQPQRHVEIKIADGLEDKADLRLMRITLDNLLGNAWKFTEKQAKAVIEFGLWKKDRKKIIYFIRDNGAGFDMAYADKLFAPFQRLHADDEFPGAGIGLATVRRILNRHGGMIRAEGEIGKGATFYFSLNEK